MNSKIDVNIISLPDDSLSMVLSFLSGVVVPLVLLGITLYSTKKAERRAIAYNETVRLLENRKAFLSESRLMLSQLFKVVQSIRHNNLKRKRFESWSDDLKNNNDKIMKSDSSEAKVMHQDLLRWHLDNMLELESEHGVLLIELINCKANLEDHLTVDFMLEMSRCIDKIVKESEVAGGFYEDLQKSFVSELNIISKQIEAAPERWLP